MTVTQQVNFAFGETSVDLDARSDLAFSSGGLSYAKNVIVKKQGGIVKRGGLEYIGVAPSQTKTTRLIPFDFGLDQTYVLALTENAIRFVTQGAILTDGSPVEVTTTYAEDELFDIGYASTRDQTYLCHWNHEPKILTRTSATTWTFTAAPFSVQTTTPTNPAGSNSGSGDASLPASLVVTAVDDDTGEESLPTAAVSSGGSGTGTATISWTYVDGATYYNIYKESNGVYGYVGRASGTSGTISFDDDGFDPDETDTPPSSRNPFGSAGNYPEAVSFYQQRLIYASTSNDPTVVEFSRSALFSNFTTSEPAKATDSISTGVLGRTVNRTRHLLPFSRRLVLLTTGGQWTITGTDEGVLQPGETKLDPENEDGVAPIPPVMVGTQALYVTRDQRTVRAIGYDFTNDAFNGPELSVTAEHLFSNRRIVGMAFAKVPDRVVYFVMSDGAALALTYYAEHEVTGWTRIETDGEFESVAVAQEGSYDAPYFVVKRTVDGATVRYIERLKERDTTTLGSGFYVDCGLTYSGSATTTISGLDHLEGETLVALADGDVVRDLVVSSGSVTLPRAASLVHIGLPYSAEARTLPYNEQTRSGATGSRKKQIVYPGFRVLNTNSFEAGRYGSSQGRSVLKPLPTQNWGDAATPTSGVVKMTTRGSYDEDTILELVSSDPIHFELLAIYPELSIGE